MKSLVLTDHTYSVCRFPDAKKKPECREAWIRAIRRKDWMPTINSYLCSEHFDDKCFMVRPNKIRRRLYELAVPTIFKCQPRLRIAPFLRPPSQVCQNPKPEPKEEEDRKRPAPLDLSVRAVDKGPSPAKVACRLGTEHSYVSRDPPLPAHVKRRLMRMRKKLKILNQTVRRKKARIDQLVDLLKVNCPQRLLPEGEHKLPVRGHFTGMCRK